MKYHIWVDHYAYEMLPWIIQWLELQSIAYQCYGASSIEDRISITEFIPQVCEAVRTEDSDFGILICGTWVGVDMWANKFQWIRSVFAVNSEVATRWKQYDNANVLCLSSWLSDKKTMIAIVEAFHFTIFEDPTWKRAKRMAEIDTWR